MFTTGMRVRAKVTIMTGGDTCRVEVVECTFKEYKYGMAVVVLDNGEEEMINVYKMSEIKESVPVVAEEEVLCSCGHSVPKSMVMFSSTGTCCPECYDRMSE